MSSNWSGEIELNQRNAHPSLAHTASIQTFAHWKLLPPSHFEDPTKHPLQRHRRHPVQLQTQTAVRRCRRHPVPMLQITLQHRIRLLDPLERSRTQGQQHRRTQVLAQQFPYSFNLDLVSVFPCFGTGNRHFQAFHTAFRRALRRVPSTDIASMIAKPNPESPD